MNLESVERIIAIIGGIIVAIIAAKALRDDWKTPGIENQVFKLMLLLLCVGGIIAFLAGAHVLGNFPNANVGAVKS
jgi:F0F1-type ATP synthase membrane subunit c/vacuolar-type H+-ATPase subunit K